MLISASFLYSGPRKKHSFHVKRSQKGFKIEKTTFLFRILRNYCHHSSGGTRRLGSENTMTRKKLKSPGIW